MLRFGRVVEPAAARLARRLRARVIEEGVVVAGWCPTAPAIAAGCRRGTLIVSLNAQEVGSRRDLYMNLWRRS